MRAQISIEYLSTFGWILLVVMVAILAVAQFGILDLANELPEECYFGEQLACTNQFVDENGNLLLTLQSNFNKEISIKNVEVEEFYVDINKCNKLKLKPGEESNIICPISESEGGPQAIFPEERQRFNVQITVTPKDSTDEIKLNGIIITNVLKEEIAESFSCGESGGSANYVCDNTWECEPGQEVNPEGYLGSGQCCKTICVENRCEDSLADGGKEGRCCIHGGKGQIPISDPWAQDACKKSHTAEYKCFPTSCAINNDDDDPEIGNN